MAEVNALHNEPNPNSVTPCSVPPNAPTAAATGSASFCAGGNVVLNVASPAANTTYLWSNGTTANSITVSTAGNYTVRAISNGCTSAVSNAIAVTVTPLPSTPTATSANPTVCGGSAFLSVSNPVANTTYLWSNGFTGNSTTASTTGSYTVRAISNGCTSAVSNAIAVTVTPLPNTPTVTGNASFCAGGNTTLSVSSPAANTTYLWSNGTTANSITVSAAGNFTVRAISNGCTSAVSQATTVSVTPLPNTPTVTGNASFCAGGNTTLSVASPAANTTYLWSNGTTANSITVSAAGNFTVRAISNGCTSAVSPATVVSMKPSPNIPNVAGNDNFCVGGNTTLSVSNPDANTTYLWSNGVTNNSITVSAAGSFTVRAISNGCTSAVSQATQVSVKPLPMAMISQTGNVLAVMEVNNATYQWLLEGQPITNATSANYTPVANGNYSIRVTLDGCDAVSNVIAVVVISVDKDLRNSLKIYPNPSNGLVNIQVSNSANDLSYSVVNALGQTLSAGKLVGEISTIDLSAQPEGMYWLKVISNEGVQTKSLVITR